MHTMTELANLKAWRKAQYTQEKSVALVPTMGNLHDGHLSLVKLAKENADKCLVSIFVNPTQFGPNEDFAAYPRTLEADLEQLVEAGADAVFAPSSPDILYNENSIKLIAPPSITNRLCGQYRPGHFDGVLQVVNKLFNLTSPDVAIFGEKDYQQLMLIRLMAADFFQPITIIGAPLVRDHNGLALSSRNRYLSESEKSLANNLHKHLKQSLELLHRGELNTEQALNSHCEKQINALNTLGFKMQYYEICYADTLAPLLAYTSAESSSDIVILAAGHLGKTRLIDNIRAQNISQL